MSSQQNRPIALAVTGASGAQYALRLLECLVDAEQQVYFMISEPGQVVIGMETDLQLPGRSADMQRFLTEYYGAEQDQIAVFGQKEWTAPVASGSGVPRAMVVCPCTMGSLSAIACGGSNNLIERAADVVLKERKQLIIVPRESPYSVIHLENMLKLAHMGAVIMDANPGFYHLPESIDDLVDFVVARILDHLDIPHTLSVRWGESG